ncbi:Hypothetical predicted protein [Octopus vulgaris]|uniref:Uncharacterized protein n=1 Tax=Octopus vulgaris TaxID=6645 RepID=A0AA36BAT1_OCTVU|nr:Hypothetical predicted protein [Octopus vulgaris]
MASYGKAASKFIAAQEIVLRIITVYVEDTQETAYNTGDRLLRRISNNQPEQERIIVESAISIGSHRNTTQRNTGNAIRNIHGNIHSLLDVCFVAQCEKVVKHDMLRTGPYGTTGSNANL